MTGQDWKDLKDLKEVQDELSNETVTILRDIIDNRPLRYQYDRFELRHKRAIDYLEWVNRINQKLARSDFKDRKRNYARMVAYLIAS